MLPEKCHHAQSKSAYKSLIGGWVDATAKAALAANVSNMSNISIFYFFKLNKMHINCLFYAKTIYVRIKKYSMKLPIKIGYSTGVTMKTSDVTDCFSSINKSYSKKTYLRAANTRYHWKGLTVLRVNRLLFVNFFLYFFVGGGGGGGVND